ncbi:hypothetical protein SUDANB171_05443 [Streptomyces sp. enrichment culture]
MHAEGHDLLQAAHRGDIAAVSAAIRAGAPLEVTDDHRRTPLLLAAGATPGLPDGEGRTPLEHAEHRGFSSLAALLREAGG